VEILLNLAWALCSLALLWMWMRRRPTNAAPVASQMLALAMVVILLLPVISLSDDLVAMQGPAESDSCVRRVLHANEGHPSVVPAAAGMPEEFFAVLTTTGGSRELIQSYNFAPSPTLLIRSLDSRPPPQA